MSWKDLKIAKKLYIGFGIVLILAMAVGLIGWNGLTSVAEMVTNADDANRLIKWAKDCRQQEKNYIMRDDMMYAEQVHETAAQMYAQIDETKARFQDQADVAAIEEANGHVKEYEAAFNDWVRYRQEAEAAMENMVAGARVVDEEAGALRAGQKAQMEQEFLQKQDHQKLAERWTKADDANRLIRYMLECRQAEKNWLLRKDDEYAEAVLTTIDRFIEQCGKTKATMRQQVNLDQIDAIVAAVGEYKDGFETYRSINEEQLKSEELMVEAGRAVVGNMDDLRAVMKDKMEAAQSMAITMAISFVVGAVLLGVFVAFVIARGISKPINKVVDLTNQMNGEFNDFVEVVEAIANNNLTQEIKQSEIESVGIDSQDEIGVLVHTIEGTLAAKGKIGSSLDKMITNLTGMVRKLSENATQLVSASTEIASTSEQMSRGSKDQAEQVNQISTAVEEMSATIVESSKNAGDATDGSKKAAETAGDGGQVINETIEGMNRIASVVRESAENINKLASSAEQIGEIIAVIDDIADQTNLLALNAAIEAARAGEQGRGFAVVADEVRKLAERTGKATGEITDMIKGIQQGTQEAVASMEAGTKEVDTGRELTDKAGASLTEIVNMSQSVVDMIQQIATASEEQSSAAEQISKNVENVASVAKESATGAEQAAAAAEELNRNAEGLKQIVAQFKVAENA